MKVPTYILLCALSTLVTVMLPSVSVADFFKYKDNSGNLIITNYNTWGKLIKQAGVEQK